MIDKSNNEQYRVTFSINFICCAFSFRSSSELMFCRFTDDALKSVSFIIFVANVPLASIVRKIYKNAQIAKGQMINSTIQSGLETSKILHAVKMIPIVPIMIRIVYKEMNIDIAFLDKAYIEFLNEK